LCKVMPVYKQAVFDHIDVPGWEPAFDGDTGLGSVAEGAKTWTLSGQSPLPNIEGLSQEDISLGVKFTSVTGSMYVVGHPDYVRSVRIVPTGPESIDLVVDWLLPTDHGVAAADEIESIVELVKIVIQQDGDVCELNQQGIHSNRHEAGVLVAQEFELWHFHEWLREKLALMDA
jgi:Rieske 2Fe-2S family protein